MCRKHGRYEDTLEDIEKAFGTGPEFMKLFPRELLIREWLSWKRDNHGEVDLERASLLSEDKYRASIFNIGKISSIYKTASSQVNGTRMTRMARIRTDFH